MDLRLRGCKVRRFGLVGAFLLGLGLGGCAAEVQSSRFPDLRVDPVPVPTAMTADEKADAIAAMQKAAARNQGN